MYEIAGRPTPFPANPHRVQQLPNLVCLQSPNRDEAGALQGPPFSVTVGATYESG